MKPSALFIVAHAPDRIARQAGQRTAQLYLDKLNEKYRVETIILCSATLDEIRAMSKCSTRIRSITFGGARKCLSILTGSFFGIPPRFATRIDLKIARDIVEIVSKHTYEIVWLEFSQVGWLLPLLAKTVRGATETVWSIHDVQSELVHRKSWLERTLCERWTRNYESRLLRIAGSVKTLSEKDKYLVGQLAGPGVHVEVTGPAISEFVHCVRRRPDLIEPFSMLMWGAMNRTENYSSALWFVRRALPAILGRCPGAILFIVGAGPPARLRAMASAQIVVTGFVEDPTPYFLRASLGVVPLTQGAGIKLKTLEMLATGLKVISTAIGAEGIPNSENLVVTDIQNMASTIIEFWSESAAARPVHLL